MQVSDDAFTRIQELLNDKENDIPETASVRVFVTGGGCSGLQYGFEITDTVEEDDTVFEKGGARIVVDSLSFSYLSEATVDYVKSLDGEAFVINNPNVKSTCGCGSSFEM